ncbi:VOC family protein [Novosphingobium bradum]|uniref:VOC family protein n=1 Tax=Novosphingobium bradum TaxID=1737444 RepID=A0ABV7ISM1_9SPHN
MSASDPHLANALAAQFVRIGYVAANVRDLERSRAFYEAVTPLRARTRTRAPLQPFTLLGEAQGRFDGWLMDDGSGGDPTCLHLIQWQEPAPRGQANPTFFHAGWGKMAISHRGAQEVLDRLAAHGVRPSNPTIHRDYVSITDPDGIVISFLPNPQRPPSLFHCVSGPSDPARTVRFYQALFGLEYWMKSQPPAPLPTSQGPGAEIVQWDSHILRAWGDHRFNIDVSKILFPAQTGTPNPDPLAIGIARIGMEVRDIEPAFDLIGRALATGEHGAARLAGPIEDWDYGPDAPRRRAFALKDPDGMHIDIYQPERHFVASAPTAA